MNAIDKEIISILKTLLANTCDECIDDLLYVQDLTGSTVYVGCKKRRAGFIFRLVNYHWTLIRTLNTERSTDFLRYTINELKEDVSLVVSDNALTLFIGTPSENAVYIYQYTKDGLDDGFTVIDRPGEEMEQFGLLVSYSEEDEILYVGYKDGVCKYSITLDTIEFISSEFFN